MYGLDVSGYRGIIKVSFYCSGINCRCRKGRICNETIGTIDFSSLSRRNDSQCFCRNTGRRIYRQHGRFAGKLFLSCRGREEQFF